MEKQRNILEGKESINRICGRLSGEKCITSSRQGMLSCQISVADEYSDNCDFFFTLKVDTCLYYNFLCNDGFTEFYDYFILQDSIEGCLKKDSKSFEIKVYSGNIRKVFLSN